MEPRTRTHSRTVAAAGNYTAGDVVSNSATNLAGTAWQWSEIAAGGQPGRITSYSMTCDEDSITARYRLHLFVAQPSTATELDDNSAKSIDNDDRANYIGYLDFPAMLDVGECSISQGETYKNFQSESGDLWGVLEDLDGETVETAGMTIAITLNAES